MTEEPILIHTDGACKGNPGPGGWAAILSCKGKRRELSGGAPATTNNRMELTAVIQALRHLTRPNCRVQIVTDSQYVKRGMEEWLPLWREKGYHKTNGKAVLNADLWRELDQAAAGHDIEWRWVRGHSGAPENEAADTLASTEAEKHRSPP